MTKFSFGPFSFAMHRPDPIRLKKGETILICYWSWKKLGWKNKAITLNLDGDIIVKRL